MRFSFILLAGGNSNRFKSNLPKPYHRWNDTLLEALKVDDFDNLKN